MQINHASGRIEVIAQGAGPMVRGPYAVIRVIPQEGANAGGSTFDQEGKEIAQALWDSLPALTIDAMLADILALAADNDESLGEELSARVKRNAGFLFAGNEKAGLADAHALEELATDKNGKARKFFEKIDEDERKQAAR